MADFTAVSAVVCCFQAVSLFCGSAVRYSARCALFGGERLEKKWHHGDRCAKLLLTKHAFCLLLGMMALALLLRALDALFNITIIIIISISPEHNSLSAASSYAAIV